MPLKIHPDSERFLHLFYVLVHYEAKHYDLLPYLVRSSLHTLEKQKNLGKFEKIMLNFFGDKLSEAAAKPEQAGIFRQLKKELRFFLKDENSKPSFILFDYRAWIESKIENKSFSEMIKSKKK